MSYMSRRLGDWIEGYLAYTGESAAPDCFHKWVAIGTIAGVLKRNIWLPMGYFNLFPNNYIVLIGPPASMKSTSILIGRDLAHQVPGMRFAVDSTSRERLLEDMGRGNREESSMMAYCLEFGSFFTTSEMNMVLFLIEMYDAGNAYEHRSRSGGILRANKPCFTIVGGTTPEWLHGGIPMKTTGIGMMSRVVLVFADRPRHDNAWPEISEAQRRLEPLLVEDLNHIAEKLNGPISYTDEAKELYNEWHKGRREGQNPDPRLQGFYGRKPAHVHKTAMALSAARRDSLVVEAQDVSDALVLLADVESTLPQAFAASGKNPLAVDLVEVFDAIRRAGPKGMTRPQLMKAFQHNVRFTELVEVLLTLETTGAIQTQMGPGGPLYFAAVPDPLPHSPASPSQS